MACVFLSYGFSNLGGCYDYWIQQMWAEIIRSHKDFIDRLFPKRLEPNPLPIIMRAVNSVKARYSIKQYRWSSRRWKSTT